MKLNFVSYRNDFVFWWKLLIIAPVYLINIDSCKQQREFSTQVNMSLTERAYRLLENVIEKHCQNVVYQSFPSEFFEFPSESISQQSSRVS